MIRRYLVYLVALIGSGAFGETISEACPPMIQVIDALDREYSMREYSRSDSAAGPVLFFVAADGQWAQVLIKTIDGDLHGCIVWSGTNMKFAIPEVSE